MEDTILNSLGQESESEPKTNKDKPKEKRTKEGDVPGLNEDILSQMLMTGENETGMFAPDEKAIKEDLPEGEELHEEQDEKAKLGKIKKTEVKDEYKKAMAEDLKKHPDKYSIETPQGRMSVAEAARKGFNPKTMQFEESIEDKNKAELDKLNEQDRAAVEKFLDPAQVGLAPADAEAFGIPEGSPMRRATTQPMPQGQAGPGAPIPGGLANAAAPAAPAVPTAAPQGAADIMSMLGGGM